MVTLRRVEYWLGLVGFREKRNAVVAAAVKELEKLAAKDIMYAEKVEIAETIELIKKDWPFNQ